MKFLFILFFLVPMFIHAESIEYVSLAPIEGFVDTTETIDENSFGTYLDNMFRLGIALCTALAVLMLIIGGIQYVSTDAWGKKSEGKERIFAALFGLVIALGSYALLRTINPAILDTNLELRTLDIVGIPTHGSGVAQTTGDFKETDPNHRPEEIKPGENIPGCTDKGASTTGKATFYYVAKQSEYGGSQTASFLDKNGNSLGSASPAFLEAARIEGTAVLTDGTVLNYASGKGNGIRWKVSNTKYGEGSRGNALVPYRTVAADPAYYNFGEKVYIKELDGMKLLDGTTHNGFVTVGDVGSAIKGPGRFDIFTGAGQGSAGNVSQLSNRNVTSTKCQ